MDVVRVIKSKDYTTICNRIFKDKRLSLKAKGLLAMLLSFSNHWDLSIMGLESILKEGRTSIRSTLNELILNGYVEREQIRKNGMFLGVDYTVFESPKTHKPITDNSKTENDPQVSNNKINNQLINTNLKNNFYDEVMSFDVYKKEMLIDFYEYWSEPTKNGIFRKEKMKTWSTSRRLKNWLKNSKKWDLNNDKVSKVDNHLKSHNEAMEILKKIQKNDNIKNI
tara:strand:+ start:1448 stop:2119 length:672 start_codon:yes stop_codon:yes gene_type:complete